MAAKWQGKIKGAVSRTSAYLKRYGVRDLTRKFIEKAATEDVYALNWKDYICSEEELKKQRETRLSYSPLISLLVPVCDPNESFFAQLLEAVKSQSYTNWELCIVDVGKKEYTGALKQVFGEEFYKLSFIKYKRFANKGISENTNEALKMATGEYVAPLDHDDLITPDALYCMALKLSEHPYSCVYSDEDKINYDGTKHFRAHIKPDFDKFLLLSNNYICHLFMVKRSIALEKGGFRKAYDGAQDYDFILRCTDGNDVGHVAKILYNWRTHESSTSSNPGSKLYAYEAGKRAISDYLATKNIEAKVSMLKDYGFYSPEYKINENVAVSVLVDKNGYEADVYKYAEYLKKNTDYPKYDIIYDTKGADKTYPYTVVIKAGMKFESADWLTRLVAPMEVLGADAVSGKLISCGKMIYAGEQICDFGCESVSQKIPSWYRGDFNKYVVSSKALVLPEYGYAIRTEIFDKCILNDTNIIKDTSAINDTSITNDTSSLGGINIYYEPRVIFNI